MSFSQPDGVRSSDREVLTVSKCLTAITQDGGGYFFKGISRNQLREFLRVDGDHDIKAADIVFQDDQPKKIVEISAGLVIYKGILSWFSVRRYRKSTLIYVPDGVILSGARIIATKKSGSMAVCNAGAVVDIKVGERVYQLTAR